MYIDKKIILFNCKEKTSLKVMEKIASRMEKEHLVSPEFYPSLVKREEVYPTGLQTSTIGIAIPHTEVETVIVPQIGIALLEEPVTFKLMNDINQTVDVSVVFVLAMKKGEEQLLMLQKLVALFQDEEDMIKLSKCSSEEEVITILKRHEIN